MKGHAFLCRSVCEVLLSFTSDEMLRSSISHSVLVERTPRTTCAPRSLTWELTCATGQDIAHNASLHRGGTVVSRRRNIVLDGELLVAPSCAETSFTSSSSRTTHIRFAFIIHGCLLWPVQVSGIGTSVPMSNTPCLKSFVLFQRCMKHFILVSLCGRWQPCIRVLLVRTHESRRHRP